MRSTPSEPIGNNLPDRDTSSESATFEDVRDCYLTYPDDVLVKELRNKELELRRLEAEIAAITTVVDHRGRFPDGHRTLKAFLRANLNRSSISAHRQRQITRLVTEFPQIGNDWIAGRLGRDQIIELAKVWYNPKFNHCFAAFAEQLTDAAVRFEFDEFMLVLQRFMLGADPDGSHDDRDTAIEGRDARIVVNGGQLDASIVGGDVLTAEELKAVFDAYVDAEFQRDLAARKAEHGDNSDGKPFLRTARQRRFDAFVAMVRAAGANTDADTSQPVVDYVVNIVIDKDRFDNMLTERALINTPNLNDAVAAALHNHQPADLANEIGDDPSEDFIDEPADDLARDLDQPLDYAPRCETESGQPIHPHDVLRAALTGHIRRVIIDSQSVVIDMGRRQRLFTGSARIAAKLLATQCCHPGCEMPVDWCDIDHNTPWAKGGRTDQHNANPPCHPHNLTKEQLGLQYLRDKHGHSRTKRADGTIILPIGMPPPDIPDEEI